MCIGLSEIMKSTSRDAVSPSQGPSAMGADGSLGREGSASLWRCSHRQYVTLCMQTLCVSFSAKISGKRP